MPPDQHAFYQNIDMQVQLFITNNCIRQIKQNLQLTKNESAHAMWSYLNQEYGHLSQNAINNTINYLCTGQLCKCKDLEDFINKYTNQINVLKFNGYDLNDKFKIKFFFRAIGKQRTAVESHCLNNNLNFAKTLSYVRNNLSVNNNHSGVSYSNVHSRIQTQHQNRSNQSQKPKGKKNVGKKYPNRYGGGKYNPYAKSYNKESKKDEKDEGKQDDKPNNKSSTSDKGNERQTIVANKGGNSEYNFSDIKMQKHLSSLSKLTKNILVESYLNQDLIRKEKIKISLNKFYHYNQIYGNQNENLPSIFKF